MLSRCQRRLSANHSKNKKKDYFIISFQKQKYFKNNIDIFSLMRYNVDKQRRFQI